MKQLVALIVAVAGTLVLAAPAEARSSVTLSTPSAHRVGKAVVVSGTFHGRAKTVRIEQRKGGRWVVVRKATVRAGAYRARASAPGRATLRVSVPGRVSRSVVVAPTVVATDACGTVVKKADGTAWSCTLRDDFSGSALNRGTWTPQTKFAMGTQAAHTCYADDPSTISVANGALNLTMRKVATPVSCTFGGMSGPTDYVSGGVMSYRLFSQQYGRFEARIKNTATTAPGLHEAFWLWPDDRYSDGTVWPYAGEIDISETYSAYPTLTIPFLHYSADVFGTLLGTNTAWNCSAIRGSWTTYTLEWSAKKVEIFVNGRRCLTNTSGDPAFAKPYIMALTQGMGATGNVYDGRAPLPATMSVDYVKVWK
ncbi:MAG: glycoside hydrolase family 16 protein [Propionibacteriales bacterium]|nr:glycoside hydrolase family 16 protein [Propionibacteriales bacterium]